MEKNKLIFILAVGLMFSPLASLVATEKTAPAKMDAKAFEALMKKDPEAAKLKLQRDMNNRFKSTLETRSLEIAEKISKDTTSKKTTPGKAAQKNINVVLERIYKGLDDKLSKLSILDSRISLKLGAFEKEGKNVTTIRDQYDTAKTALLAARTEISSTKNVAFTQVGIQTSKEEIRSLVKMAETKIKSAGGEYRKILPMFAKLEGDNSIKN